ncbi:MAG: cofactor-independent phosphoglycerate mutase [Candidatus Hydrothermarchaeales archaeon]
MKYVIIIGDGMADFPLDELDGKTPLEVAHKPNIDSIASKGKLGTLKTIPNGMEAGSDIANLSILGYDPKRYYTGRGPLEAASIGVELRPDDMAFRCNLITEEDGHLKDYCAGHITIEEAVDLIKDAKEAFKEIGDFYPGVSYRHLFVLRDGGDELKCTPPHDVTGGGISSHLIKPEDNAVAKRLNSMILNSKDVLSNHPVNIKRIEKGLNPANMIWLWGQGRRPKIEPLKEKYGVTGAVVSAVDLIRGIGIYAEMDILDVPGATGYYDTDYEAKADYAARALKDHDLVYVHIESIDEAGHAGDVEMKIKCIEDFDERLVGRLLDNLTGDYSIAILPDHYTPIMTMTHDPTPVPFVTSKPRKGNDGIGKFTESTAKRGSFGSIEGEEFMRLFLNEKS